MDFALPAEGAYATGIAFLPQGDADAHEAADAVEKIVDEEGLKVLGWREVANRRLVARRTGARRDADVPSDLHRQRG